MGMFITTNDKQLEDTQTTTTCSSFYEKSLKDDALSSLEFVESQQQGLEITLSDDSIENGLEVQKRKKRPLTSALKNPRRRRVCILLTSFIVIGIILVIVTSATVSNKKTTKQESALAANSIWDEGVNEGSTAHDDTNSIIDNGDVNSHQFPVVESEAEGTGSSDDSTVDFSSRNVGRSIPPLSVLDPVVDLSRYGYDRPVDSSPSARLDPLRDQNKGSALPTNAWYQNMLRLDADQNPTKDHRVYTVPYILDAAGTFPGIRAHATRLDATPTQVTLLVDEPYALTLGATADVKKTGVVDAFDNNGYSVQEATDLGLTLQWDSFMKSTLVRGSPYVTMMYNMADAITTSSEVLPTMRWELDTSELPVIDGSRTLDCQSEEVVFTVERDLDLTFLNSGQRWLVFFSRPVQLQCHNVQGQPTIFQVLKGRNDYNEDPLLIIRAAMVVSSSSADDDDEAFSNNYANQLRAHANTFPGQSTSISHAFTDNSDRARITFNWDPQSMRQTNNASPPMISRNGSDTSDGEMIMFALPHHQDVLDSDTVMPNFCTTSLVGRVCLAKGNAWSMYEDLPPVDFQAPRHPDPRFIPVIAEALMEDIHYQIPENFQSGAGDTYFSGKTIARLARILLITEEVKDLCESSQHDDINRDYMKACDGVVLPSIEEIDDALEQLRATVTVWVKTNNQAPFVYDNAWGGLISCGCLYNDGECSNQFPDCPAFTDQGLNFGNGFYNDHHFHYGYHIYAAAVLAHFDPEWAINHYEDVLLLVRDYANPSTEDTAFPTFRNKDWYRGHSWASGLTEPMFRDIMNQESTSEAIAAYESVALFGKVMTSIFQETGNTEKASVAKMMHNIGLTLTATEIRSTQKYWQVRQNVDDSEKRFPKMYTASVVGILWETFVQFTTWFGNAPYLIYGIQLLPLTPISEWRDNLNWAEEVYAPLSQSCNQACVSEGWSIQINAILATIGRVQEAVEAILKVPASAYDHAGGNGHSRSNSLWYIATRPATSDLDSSKKRQFEVFVPNDIPIIEPLHDNTINDNDAESPPKDHNLFDGRLDDLDDFFTESASSITCFYPTKCTDQVLNTMAEGHSCRDRIQYLMDALGKTEIDACWQVAEYEYPQECGLCRPTI